MDLGSVSPVILPSTSEKYPHLALQGGKDGCVRLVNLDNMSGMAGAGHVGGELNPTTACSQDGFLAFAYPPMVWSDPANGSTHLYGGSNAETLVFDASGNPAFQKFWGPVYTSSNAQAAIANGAMYVATDGGGNIIKAYNVNDGTPLWSYNASNNLVSGRGLIVAKGRIYLIAQDSSWTYLYVFALDGIFRSHFD